jgi:hypothetical protein
LVPQALTPDKRSEQIMQKVHGHIVENSVEARAGHRDSPVLAVALVSTILAFIVLGGVWLSFFGH